MSVRRDQLRLSVSPFHNRKLFADGFLTDRLREWPEFAGHDVTDLRAGVLDLWNRERDGLTSANEAQTEERFIQPLLGALGFSYTVQVGMRLGTGRRQPDYALFLDEHHRREADRLSGRTRFRHAAAVADAKRFDRPLDGGRAGDDDAVAQIIHYVLATGCSWGLLTNGRLWRLYAAAGDLLEGACYEVDLVELLETGGEDDFRYFSAFFSAGALSPDARGRSFLDRALEESTANAIAVGDALERQVFAALPLIAEGLIGAEQRTKEALAAALDNSLVLLYRLLFCLHAEARGLLPVDNVHYAEYSLRTHKQRVAADVDAGRVFSSQSDDLYNDVRGLFRIVDSGDPAIGVAEFDGGLFSAARHPYFEGRSVPDSLLAPAVDGLYRVRGQFVDYRELSVRHLGSIYERLLQYRLADTDDAIALVAAPGRRASGSYFTPEHIVDRIVERTLEPLLETRSRAIAADRLSGEEALERFLELRVLDPAMGSAHFLVGASAYIAQYIATDPSYDGTFSLLELQRLVAERCLYGVDVNPLAVELARLALWLTTARADDPLTFLHNLRDGNSLVGADLSELLTGGDTIFTQRLAAEADELLRREAEIASAATDVHEMQRLADAAEALRRPLEEYAGEQLAGTFSDDVGRPFHWEIEFPEVFISADGLPRADGGFDAIVGNPPWVRIQALGRELADYCRRRYETASGAFDTYVVFLERSVELLNPHGRLGFIVPNKLLKLDYGRKLREQLAGGRLVDEIVDFGDAQVFEGATNYSCILLLDRSGRDELRYRRLRGNSAAIERVLNDLDRAQCEPFAVGGLGGEPWTLLAGEEAAVMRAASEGSARLDEVTRQIFQGLITSADPVYIVEDRGRRGSRRVVYSRAGARELELEPDLLRPLASGVDVDRYAFRPLQHLLLFPYRQGDGRMELLSGSDLARLPLTAAYLREHEAELRGRERGKMDHDRWYGYVYPKSLGLHDQPKLGVAATVQNLEVAGDPAGSVYFHNVRVNGIVLSSDGPSLWTLLALLNSRLLDWLFRRGAAEHANGYYAANKQFIAPLPIQVPTGAAAEAFDALGRRLHDGAAAISEERHGFLDWLGDAVGARVAELPGVTTLSRYDQHSAADLVDVLRRSSAMLAQDPSSRAFRDRLAAEHALSLDRLTPLLQGLARDEAAADSAVYELYGLPASHRELVEREYARTVRAGR